ncbi:Imm49 family immunity protein [Acinetobacter nematophilus]|uniref:Imm49 family immunity protein n=1 Tax=Acinetobacter nematophilus TaxID=2994642 RepID=A0A9X3DUV5_9GAMM|nr:Imm49 family immunity protein [Acinetobacter nematophilus]MCX5468919.1 Imm49 family immunity protein [Acinetobacter nematophilus]
MSLASEIEKKIDRLNSLYINEEIELSIRLRETIGKNQHDGYIYTLISIGYEIKGFKSWLIDNNVDQLKQWFYVASLLRVESCNYSRGYSLSTPDEFIFPILSDSEEIIKKFGNLDTVNLLWGDYGPSYQEAKFKPSKDDPRYRTHALQAVLRHDWEDYQRIKDTANQKINKLREVVEFEFGVYDAIYHKDKDKIIDIIQTLLKPRVHKAYNKDFGEELSGEIWSHHPVMFTKLAWMNGLEIEIDNSLVPMELMPIKPLEHYDYHYDFLDPNWKPQSFLGRLFGRK